MSDIDHDRWRRGESHFCIGCGRLPPHQGCAALCAACAPPNDARACDCAGCALIQPYRDRLEVLAEEARAMCAMDPSKAPANLLSLAEFAEKGVAADAPPMTPAALISGCENCENDAVPGKDHCWVCYTNGTDDEAPAPGGCVFCGHANDMDCGMSDCRCMRCKEGHALDRDREDAARLRRRVAALTNRLARVLDKAQAHGGVWSRARVSGDETGGRG